MKHSSTILETELAIIQAPMAGVQDAKLAIAVSNAGGLGSLPAGMLTLTSLREELRTLRSGTAKPYNVNFFCHRSPPIDSQIEARWQELLKPYYQELEIDVSRNSSGSTRAPFDHDMADVLEEFRPPVVSFHFGLPDPELLQRLRAWKPLILSSATTVDEALWLEAHGASAIIAQGLEAGGHRGHFLSYDLSRQMNTFPLVRQIAEKVKLPIIAAGGIAETSGIATALELGCAAVQLGTVYLLCPEAKTSNVHRMALQSHEQKPTEITNLFSGGAARGVLNRLMREIGPMNSLAPPFPLASAAISPLRAKAEGLHSGDFSPLWSGTNNSKCRDIPAGKLTRELMDLNFRLGTSHK